MTSLQYPTDTYLDFINRNYGSVRYLPQYMDITGVYYNDFITGVTMLRDIPEIILEDEPNYSITFPKETEYILNIKNKKQTLYDIALQNYGDIEKSLVNLQDSRLTNVSLYRDHLEYKKVDILKNDLSEYYKRNKIKVSTGGNLIEILPQGEVFDIYGDYEDDYSNDFTI